MNLIRFGNDGALSIVQDTMAGSKSPLDHGGVSPDSWNDAFMLKAGNRGLNHRGSNSFWRCERYLPHPC
jgi:hypothetical protein